MAKTKVISFFSYKGGAGRSTLAYNLIPILAKDHIHPTKAAPIIVIDMDIDSCGMSYLLEVEKSITEENCVQHLLGEGCSIELTPNIYEHPSFCNLIPVGEKFGYSDNDAVLFMPAMDIKNVDNTGGTNYNDKNNPFKRSLEQFILICSKYNVPAIIFDSAVGNNATANASNQVADIVVCCMRPTKQFVNGTLRFLKGVSSSQSPWGNKDRKVVIVPNVVPQEKLVIDNDRYPSHAINTIIDEVDKLREKNKNLYAIDMIHEDEFGIPAVASFMWCEGQLCTKNMLNDNEKLALERYKKLAAVIYKLQMEME